MIINSGQRTDIPAFYSKWFFNRIKEGFVLVRNPYYPNQVTRYEINPEVVDLLSFCTKNPAPMLGKLDKLSDFRQFWSVTITPYGKEIEPNVPPKAEVMESFRALAAAVGAKSMSWRYDPIFISEKYSADFHIKAFEKMAEAFEGSTENAVISFIDLYEKTRRNFPGVKEVAKEQRLEIGEAFAEIGKRHGIIIRTCCEGEELAQFGIDTAGCATREVIEHAIGEKLVVPKAPGARSACNCLLGNDIGMYNTCPHLCKYCYANYDKETVLKNIKNHNPDSPLLIGNLQAGDIVKEAKQSSYISNQISF